VAATMNGKTDDRLDDPASATSPTQMLPAAVPRVRSRGRRRPWLLALGVILTCLGALTGVWMINAVGERTRVLTVARHVPYGSVVTEADFAVAEVSVDPSVATVPATELGRVVGSVAATELRPGMLLSRDAVTTAAPPGDGEVLVAVAFPAGRLPAGSLQAGDRILVVDTPAPDAEAPTAPPATIPATVVRLAEPDLNGVTVVDVTVSRHDGPSLAARAATGRIAVVVEPRGDSR
jgi:SAF domain